MQEGRILSDMPDAESFEEARRKLRIPKDAPPELISNYEMPLLTKDQEQHMFRKMNFLKHKAATMLAELKLPSGLINYAKLRVESLDQIEDYLAEANKIKFDPIDKAHSAEMIGSVLGVPFLGYAFTIAIGSPLLDAIGMGILLPMSGVLFIVGTLIILFQVFKT